MPSNSPNESLTELQSPLVATTLIGKVLKDRYLIESELKRGGFGVVYLACDRQLHSRPVVVKVLLDEAYQNEYVVQKFQQEIEALSRLNHPGVVGILDSGELDDGKPFIVMQFVEGTTLRSLIRAGGIDRTRVAEIIGQMCRALAAAHEKGIFHRDLKPENVMLQDLGHEEQQVKIIDFGIAKIKDSLIAPNTATNVAAGTVSYMAPEQLLNRPVTAATDVYALGQIAYELLTGRKPFNPETGFELLEMQRAGLQLPPASLRPELRGATDATILQALSFDPEKRQQRARDFGEALTRALLSSSINSATILHDLTTPEATRLPSELTPLAQKIDARTDKTVAVSFPIVPTSSVANSSDTLHDRRSNKRSIWVGSLLSLLLLLIAVSLGTWYVLNNRTKASTNESVATTPTRAREMSYWLTVQKMREGKPYQDQFNSSGQEIFENGWKFQMNLNSSQAGYLYLLNEGPGAGGATTFNLLFPSPSSNSGASYLAADHPSETGWMVFDENQGTEKFWIVWSQKPVTQIEEVRSVLNEKDHGTITDASQVNGLRAFLTNGSSATSEVDKQSNFKRTILRADSDPLIHLIELEHH